MGKDGTLQLKAGMLKMKAKADEVRLIEDDERAAIKKKTPAVTDPATTPTVPCGPLPPAGSWTSGAWRRWRRRAWWRTSSPLRSWAHLETVTIIHGKGTGALRKAVHAILRRSRAVKAFRLGVYGEGESGVTVVTLK